LKGLSGINGNIYVPFLGGLGAAMPPGYPVRDTEMCPSYPAHQFLREFKTRHNEVEVNSFW
jgi:hypothetical protein